MAAIDVGPGATDRGSVAAAGSTRISGGNPANGSGTINSIELWYNSNGSDVKCGVFYGTAPNFTSRDYETIGSVTAGSKQTFTGLDCDVQTNDVMGHYESSGQIEYGANGGDGSYYKSGDQFGAGQQAYSETTQGDASSMYGTGITGWTNIAKVCGVTATDLSKVDGIAVADIAKIDGVTV